MKQNVKNIIISLSFLPILLLIGCTNLEEINTNPKYVYSTEQNNVILAKSLLTTTQLYVFAPSIDLYFNGAFLHADRFGGYFGLIDDDGANKYDETIGYLYNQTATDIAWNAFTDGYTVLFNYLNIVEKISIDSTKNSMLAVGLIMKAFYFQTLTNLFGDVPYPNNLDVLKEYPLFEEQKNIYRQMIVDLDTAITYIATAEKDDIKEDLIYQGEWQKWKKFANTLKLRLALRALDFQEDDFASIAIRSALDSNFFISQENEIAKINKYASVLQNVSASYKDIWDGMGIKWRVGQAMVDSLQKHSDPRLEKFASKVKGSNVDGFTLRVEGDGDEERIAFIVETLKKGGVPEGNIVDEDGGKRITIETDTYYVGVPLRINKQTQSLIDKDMFSPPHPDVMKSSFETIITAAESYFLKSEAVVRGYRTEDNETAQELLKEGIIQSMMQWNAENYNNYLENNAIEISNADVTSIRLRKIAIQRWIANYTVKYEGWAIARHTGHPDGVNTTLQEGIFTLGSTGGQYPQRLRYGKSAYMNPNINTAINRYGGKDSQSVPLWWSLANK